MLERLAIFGFGVTVGAIALWVYLSAIRAALGEAPKYFDLSGLHAEERKRMRREAGK